MKNSLGSQIGGNFVSFKSNTETSQEMSKDLQERTERVKELIDTYDNLSEKVQDLEEQYEIKAKRLFDTDKVTNIKEAINKLKNELFGMNVQVGVYRGHIVREQVKQGGDAFEMYNLDTKNSHLDNYDDDSFDI